MVIVSLSKVGGDGRSSIKVVLPENWPPETAVPVLKLYYPSRDRKIQLAAGDCRSCIKVVLPEIENIQLTAGDCRSSTKFVLPENEKNPAGRRRLPFQY